MLQIGWFLLYEVIQLVTGCVELFWYILRSVNKRTDDQVGVNRASDITGIQWRSLNIEGYHEDITNAPTSLTVTTFFTNQCSRCVKLDHANITFGIKC